MKAKEAKEIKELVKQFPDLVVTESFRGIFELSCTKCNENLVISQETAEISDLRFNPQKGFYAGKPEVVDGSESVRCGCGTEYPIEEWEPY